MRWAALILLGACDSIFGIHRTQHEGFDAMFFDAPADAPFVCPAAGPPPAFSKLLHQVVEQDCYLYTTSAKANIAVGACNDPSPAVYQGAIDGPLSPMVLSTQFSLNNITRATLAPDGERMFADAVDGSGYMFVAFAPVGDGSWQDAPALTLPFSFTINDVWSVPSSSPGRRMMYYRNDATVHELVETTPDSWSDARATPYSLSDLGVTQLSQLQLSPDGLRWLAYGELATASEFGVLYTSRAKVTDDFPPFVQMTTLPIGVSSPFMTEDCARVYFSGLGSVLYVQQQ